MPAHGSRVLGRMPDIDLDIFRELYGGGGVTSFGHDPRINASVIARRLKVSRARVAGRLAEWTRIGLLRRYDVWPNPALFGLELAGVDIRVTDRLRKGAVYERLGLIDGLLGGVDLLGEWCSVQLLGRDSVEVARRVELIRGLADVAEVSPPMSWGRLEPEHELTPLELRIVRVLRRYPTDPLASVARHVGVSTRTITTRYGRLLDDRSVWFVPVLDFRSLPMPVLSVQVRLDDPADRATVSKGVRRAYPQALEFLGMTGSSGAPERPLAFVVLPESAAGVEQVEAAVRAVPGVAAVEIYTMVQMLSFPATWDRLLAADSAGSGARNSHRTSPSPAGPAARAAPRGEAASGRRVRPAEAAGSPRP